MGFAVPDLIIESVIRDGLENIKNSPEIIDDVFSELTKAYASRKYGATEIARIKALIADENIAVVHSFHAAAAKSPCFSIQLGNDGENARHDYIDDHNSDDIVDITDSAKLDALKKVDPLTPTSYDPTSGMVRVDDSIDLSTIYERYIYVDGSGTEFVVQQGISNVVGDKFFNILPSQSPDIVNPGLIKSFLSQEQFEVRGTVSQVDLLIGVHTKEALLTKYMYILLKYILQSRKKDLIQRCFENMVLKGSDFTRDIQYQGDRVYTRFLTVSGRVDETWRSDQVELIDHVVLDAVPVDDC